VRITRDGDPERPIVAQANIDLHGRLVRAQVHGGTDRDALARLEERLRNRLHHVSRTAGTWEDRRGGSAPSTSTGSAAVARCSTSSGFNPPGRLPVRSHTAASDSEWIANAGGRSARNDACVALGMKHMIRATRNRGVSLR